MRGLVIVGLSAAAALREPLAVQVSVRRRPRRATTLALFLSVLVFVGAGVAAYRSRGADGQPDVVVLLGPALVGLALGQAAIWVVRLAARGLTPVTEKRGMGAFLAARRLARADDLVTPIRLVVAAAVVGALALSGAVSVSRWTGEQAAVEVPGARTIATDLGAMGAVDLTEKVDPDGEHLIATTIVRNEARLPERRAYVDAARWDAVVGDFYDGTPARAASDAIGRLTTGVVPLQVTGDRFEVTLSGLVVPPVRTITLPDGDVFRSGGGGAEVTLSYVSTANASGSVAVQLEVPLDGSPVSGSARVRDCAQGCTVTGLQFGRNSEGVIDDSEFEVLAERITLGDTDLLDSTWVPDASSVEAVLNNNFLRGWEPPATVVVNRLDGLQVAMLPQATLQVDLDRTGDTVPVLAADEEAPQALDLGGDDRSTQVLGDRGLDAAGRQRRADLRHPHLGRRLRPHRPVRRGPDHRRRGHAPGDARRRGRGHRVLLAHPRHGAGVAGRAPRRRPVRGVRPHRPRLRARRPARARRRRRPAPA